MTEFSLFLKTTAAEMRPYVPGEELPEGLAIAPIDRDAGHPKVGDWIARNPKNHRDQWLVAGEYFRQNFIRYPGPAFLEITNVAVGSDERRRRYFGDGDSFGDGGGPVHLGDTPADVAQAIQVWSQQIADGDMIDVDDPPRCEITLELMTDEEVENLPDV